MKPFGRVRKNPMKDVNFCDACGRVRDDRCRSDRVRRRAVARAGMRLL